MAAAFGVVCMALAIPQGVLGQAYPTWQGTGTNWTDSGNWDETFGYGQLEWTGNGNATSWNNNSTNPLGEWRLYFSGSQGYTLGGNAVSFFDFGTQRGGILSDSSVTQAINMNLNFADNGSRDMFILTRGAGGLTLGGTVDVTNNVTALGIGGSNSSSIITFNGPITGTKPLVIGTNTFDGGTAGMGATRVVFAGNNSYTGDTTVANGALTISHASALGATSAGTTVASGAALRLSNGITVGSEALTLNGSGISSSGALESVSGNNTWQGNITLNSASLIKNSVSGGNLTLSGAIGGSGGFTNSGAGTITFSGSSANTASGASVISEGTTIFNKSASTAAIAAALTVNSGATLRTDAVNQLNNQLVTVNGTLNLNNNWQQFVLAGAGTVSLGSAALTNTNTGTDTFSGQITGTGSLTKAGTGVLVLSGSNTYSGGTSLSGGLIEIRNNAALGTGTITNLGDGAGLSTDSTARTIANNLFITNNMLIGGTGALQIDGTVTVGLSRDLTNNNSGGLVISNLALGNNASSRTFRITGTGNTTINGVISNAAGQSTNNLEIFSSGITRLNGANTYSGLTTISSTSSVVLGSSTALGGTGGGTTMSSGGTLDINGQSIEGEILTLAGTGAGGNGALRNAGSGSASWTGLITLNTGSAYIGATNNTSLTVSNISGGTTELWVVGAGTTVLAGGATNSGSGTAFVKTNTGTAILMSSNAWTGAEFIREGTVILSNNNALGVGGTTTVGPTTGSANATLTLGTGIINSNAVTFQSGGTGVLTLGYGGASGTGTQLGNITQNNNATFNVASGGTFRIEGTINNSATVTNQVTGGGTLIFSAASTGGSLNQLKIGAGTVVLGVNNAGTTNTSTATRGIDLGLLVSGVTTSNAALYASNGVTVSNSIYVAANSSGATRTVGVAGSGAATINNQIFLDGNLTTDVASGNTLTISGNLTNTGGIIKTGAGTLVLTAVNTNSGALDISNGVVLVTESRAIAQNSTGNVVRSGAALELTNNIGMPVAGLTINGSGIGGNGAIRSIGGSNSINRNITLGSDARVGADSGAFLVISNFATNGFATIEGTGRNLTVSGDGNTRLTANANLFTIMTGAGGSLTKVGNGTLFLNGTNNYTGDTTVTAGSLQHFSGVANSILSSNIVINGGTMRLVSGGANNNITNTANLNISSGEFTTDTFVAQQLSQLNLSGGTLTRNDGANFTFTGSASVTGGTVIVTGTNAGVLVNAGLALGGANIVYSNANNHSNTAVRITNALTYAATNTTAAWFTNAAAGVGRLVLGGSTGGSTTNTFDIADAAGVGSEVNIDWVVTGSANSLLKTGNGVLTLLQANTHSNLVINGGTVRLGNDSSPGAGSLILSNGTIASSSSAARTFANATTIGGDMTFGDGVGTGSLTFSSTATNNLGGATRTLTVNAATTIAGALGNGGITKEGTATLTLSNANNNFGPLTINAGTVAVSNRMVTTGLAGGSGATLNLTSPDDAIPQFITDGSGTNTFAGTVTGTAQYVKRGTGMQIFTGQYSNTSGIYVDAGSVNFDGTAATVAAGIIDIGSRVFAARQGDSAEFRIGGTNGGRTFTNNIGVWTNSGSATRTLASENTGGVNTWSGNITNTALSNGGFLVSNATGGVLIFSGVISSTGNMTKVGGGEMVLSGSNTYSGTTTLSNGLLTVANSSGLGTGVLIQSSGASTVRFTNAVTVTNNMSVYNVAFLGTGNKLTGTITNNNATYDVFAATTNEISGYLTGTGGVTKIGDGLLVLSGSNDYTGDTSLINGVLRLAQDNALGGSTLFQTDGTSTLQVSNAITVTNTMSVYNVAFLGSSNTLAGEITNNNATFNVATGETNTITGRLSGPGGLTKIGGGGLILDGANNNTYLGATVISNGALILSNSGGNSIHNSSGISVIGSDSSLVLGKSNMIGDSIGLTLDGGTFLTGTSTTGYAETLGTLTLSSTSTIDFGSWAGGGGTRNINFADSSAVSWGSGTLILTNWTQLTNSESGAYGRLYFGNSSNALTTAQLDQIKFYIGGSIYDAKILSDGEVVIGLTPIPEPRVYAAAAVLLLAVGWRERRRIAGLLRRKQ